MFRPTSQTPIRRQLMVVMLPLGGGVALMLALTLAFVLTKSRKAATAL